jgi:hypothetical protein
VQCECVINLLYTYILRKLRKALCQQQLQPFPKEEPMEKKRGLFKGNMEEHKEGCRKGRRKARKPNQSFLNRTYCISLF